MQKVRELYAKYNLDRLEANQPGSWIYFLLRPKKKRLERHLYAICSLLSDHFLVQVVYTDDYDARDLCKYKAIELLGTKENVLMAEYVYHFLNNQLSGLWNHSKKAGGHLPQARQSYFLGVLSGFRQKLESQAVELKISQGERGTALIPIGDRQLEEFVSSRYPRLRSTRGGIRRYDASAYSAGKAAGSRLNLHKPVAAARTLSGRFLTR